jgi:hypothetical protein
MDLFSCRNCIYNPSQGLTLGMGSGYCMKWRSLIERPGQTTCKYLHRKDLPRFLTEESLLEHAEEFAACPSMADLASHEPRAQRAPSENRDASINPLTWEVITCHSSDDRRLAARFPLFFAGSVDGERAMVHACLVRGGLHPGPLSAQGWDWASSLLDDLDRDVFLDGSALLETGTPPGDALQSARWEVFFARLSGLQELGWHASIDALKFPMDELGSVVAEQNWSALRDALGLLKQRWRPLLDTPLATALPVLKDKAVSKGQSSPLRELH